MKFEIRINENIRGQGVIVSTLFLMVFFALTIVVFSLYFNSSIPSNTAVIYEERVRPLFLPNLQPEPLERRIYILICLLLPVVSLLALLGNQRYCRSFNFIKLFGEKAIFSITLLIVTILSASIFMDAPYIRASLGMYPLPIEQDRSFRISTIITSSAVFFLLFKWLRRRPEVIFGRAYWICFFALLTIIPWRYFSEATMIRSAQWWGHADLIFYAIAQAALGKTIYVDVMSQYGFYPEFFSLFFKILEPSVKAVGVSFLFLQALALFSVIFAINKVIKNNLLFFITSLAILGACSSMPLYLAGYGDAYLQYWPIRFLFPAVSIYLFSKYIECRSFHWALVIGFVAALAPFWNIDTGIVVFGAWLFYNLNGAIIRYRDRYLRRHHIINLATSIIFLLLILVCFITYIFIKSNGKHLSYEYLLGFQRIFWINGFFMLPMPLGPSVWMYFLAAYFTGICIAQYFILNEPLNRSHDFVLYISTIGLGVFTYYQGRSHELNLIAVSYPFFILIGVFVDLVITDNAKIRRYLLCGVAFPGILLMGLSAASLTFRVDRLYEGARGWFASKPDSALAADLSFVKQSVKAHESCLILAPMQGYFHLSANIKSPYNGPSWIEMILEKDEMGLYDFIKSKKAECLILGVGALDLSLKIKYLDILNNYVLKETNFSETLVYLVPIVDVYPRPEGLTTRKRTNLE